MFNNTSWPGDFPGDVSEDDECSFLPVLNLTSEKAAKPYLLNSSTNMIVLATMFIILAVGVPGNLAFIYLIYRVKHMRNATNMYLTSLAVVDLTFLSITIFTYYFYFTSPVRTHLTTAKIVGCIGAFCMPYVTYFVSVANVTLVSLDKYNAICSPIKYIQRRNKARASKLIVGSCISGVGLAALVMLRYGKLDMYCAVWPDKKRYRNLPVVLGYCVPVSFAGLVIGHLVEVTVFILALVSNMIMYTRIIIRLSARIDNKKLQQQTMSSQALQVRNQVARLLIANGVVFFLCQTPFQAVSLAFVIGEAIGTPRNVLYRKLVLPLSISYLLVFLNSAINPIIYNLASSHYRNAFKKVLCVSRRKKARPLGPSLQLHGIDNKCFEDREQAEGLGLSPSMTKL
ncbi:thyrotropin-releasing hormone receptor-like [Asterias amurensis]|uniref:thyrotropin-releasing hormone receptor-like n=1 Tax=Asterias amurensis TaxID=7602 RepID=UPI003AB78D26